MNTAARIKSFRLQHDLTQKQLAQKIDVDPITVSRWERGETHPSDLYRVRIARALGVHPNDLLSEEAA